MGHAPIYHPETLQTLGEPSHLRPLSRNSKGKEVINLDDPRPLSVRTSGSKKRAQESSAPPQQGGPSLMLHRNSSRHSHYDPATYVDPAFWAPDGSVVPTTLHVPGAASPNMRRQSRTPSLEYVDPPSNM